MTSTRLTPGRYLDLLHAEGERLLVAAEEVMDRPVPTCEGWTVDDLVFHVGGVYAHKLAALRLGRRPVEGEWDVPADDATAGDDLTWCHVMLHALAAELATRSPDEPAWTWWPDDRTIGFWQRRMALETAVHRADAESATGPISAVDADLALDGIDEVLTLHLADADFAGTAALEVLGGVVRVRVDAVTITGSASDVLLWLWGRLPDDVVTISGAEGDRAEVRRILREATQ